MAPSPEDGYAPWSNSVADVFKHFDVDVKEGLTDEKVAARRAQYGYNELEKEAKQSIWAMIAEQFEDTLVRILLLAAIVSFGLAWFEEDSHEEGIRAFIEPLVILLILVLNAAVGVWQESNAESALEALKELQTETAHVTRNGKLLSDLPARELLPGDVVHLHVGDKVPADCRMVALKTATVRAEQASLTGESVAVNKSTDPVADPNCELQAKECMVFAGTAIANGSCTAVVTSIGMATEIGKIQAQISEAAKEDDDTPLKKKLNEFGEMLAKVIAAICVIVWLINYHHFLTITFKPEGGLPTFSFNLSKATYYFKIAVALAVAAIPEGLPAVITTCLALGTRTMAKKNAIVRKLPSVETLGCTTVICSDKTGTLTTNQMSAVALTAFEGPNGTSMRRWVVAGHTYNPDEGEVEGLAPGAALDKALQTIAEVCAVCSEAQLEFKGSAFRAVGAPTEAALLVLAEKLGLQDPRETAAARKKRTATPEEHPQPVSQAYRERAPIKATLEFDRDRKSMSVLVRPAGSAKNSLLVKGAAECVIERSTRMMLPDGRIVPLTDAARSAVLGAVQGMARDALRCLAIAVKPDVPSPLAEYNGDSHHPAMKLLRDPATYASVESDLVLVGLAGLQDPPRPEVRPAIENCKQAGIRVMVITGDNKDTAEAICTKIGVFQPGDDLSSVSFTGRAFVALPRERQLELLAAAPAMCFSRAEPRHKQDIVRLLKEQGEVAAMTGDGVNDAPALKLADIGVAMGIAGTEVAKEASDMVLADDNFSSIVAAVAEGRAIYNNMKAFIRYMISSNIGEVASIFLTAALGLPEGLIPVQLLWVNLVTDGPPATALGFNPPDKDIMSRPPRRANDQLITPWVFFRYMVIGGYVGVATVGAFVSWYMFDHFVGIDLSRDGHTTVTWEQLTNWQQCREWGNFTAAPYKLAGGGQVSLAHPCEYFSVGKAKASTLSLSVIVAIEMFNALNALSEDGSLLAMPPWSNPWLLTAISVSVALHCVILYVPFLADVFAIVPLSWPEWQLVLLWSAPVILLDEVLKFVGRIIHAPRSRAGPKGAGATRDKKNN
ncbi:hypothetical protein VOLCADRAFT_84661 [Volvox carteri f. nagariensis]|uniref:P-type Ca(2+) transporter n=1 Tax=Volvox carteri f. nagariensis TaxID=3068 RepID=D8UJK8_VOLCA|nr:uncharacterized protein VOLCADRAFT_84661 [Volvox carteri f. nagariensis]EFJ40103.1 hypothetical protein VOLCADRAFT_84661 [Volvox carteri f. nagariensis]|eukprot:XP_002958852.1 hypothetical protein VOLCADRAFT_84661 [Volvox carteri f. nagariensis]